MIKEGDKVAPFDNIGHTGTVVKVEYAKIKTWMVGGAMSKQRIVFVRHEDGNITKYKSQDLMNLHDR